MTINIDTLVNLLQDYDLITALDGKTALNILHEEEVDLVLLDIMMPNMDGFEVCKKLKKDEKTKHIHVIFLTVRDSGESIQAGFNLGAVD